jgi:hypothetical protein
MSKKLFLFTLVLGLLSFMTFQKDGFTAGAQVLKIDQTEHLTDTPLENPCDPSGDSNITANVDETFIGNEITLPDGSKNGTVRVSIEGEGTDSQDNTYEIIGTGILRENHDASVGTVAVIRVTSSTGEKFIGIIQNLDLNNHSIDHDKTFCLGNN